MFEVKKARLNTDNVPAVTEMVSGGIPILTMGRVATTTVKNDRGITNLNSEGGDISMKDSLNRKETHSIANDESTSSVTGVDDTSDNSIGGGTQ
jgi:hypothetical protein